MSPNKTGITTLIFVATETTERPLRWVVIAIKLKTIIKRVPKTKVKLNHSKLVI